MRAAERACRASAGFETAIRPSRRSFLRIARERVGEGFFLDRPRLKAN
jgi:hypothetical protein